MPNNKIILAAFLFTQSIFAAQTKSFGGSQIPQAVQEFIQAAKANGAVFYDVNELDKDGEPKYNPHFSTTQATGSMVFENTEITPYILQKDIDSKKVGTILSGYTSYEYEEKDETTGQMVKRTGQEATYKEFTGGTGHVAGHYDEAIHSDHFARGMEGQKWANNCGILEDGALHCLPAMRRSNTSDYILVNPDLSRGTLMLFNGHIDIRAGVIESIEVSGRLSKLIGKGKIKMIDPVALFKAWGFKISPSVNVTFSNTEAGVPKIDPATGFYVSPNPPKPPKS